MKNISINTEFHSKKIWFYAFCTILALNNNFATLYDNKINGFLFILSAFKTRHVISLLIFFIIGVFYKKSIFIYNTIFFQSERKYIYLPAMLYSLFVIIGISFELNDSWQLIWGNIFKIIRGLTTFTGYFYLFSSIITFIFYYFDQLKINGISILPPPSETNNFRKLV